MYQAGVINMLDVYTDRSGTTTWRLNGQYHREDGPAIAGNDYTIWYINGLCHRLDGPAFIEKNGSIEYWVNGLRHRIDGPAVIYADGSVSYWIKGEKYTELEFFMRTGIVN